MVAERWFIDSTGSVRWVPVERNRCPEFDLYGEQCIWLPDHTGSHSTRNAYWRTAKEASVTDSDSKLVIDLNETCTVHGRPMAECYKVHHRTEKLKKGLKGTCPRCGGPAHNDHDRESTIQFQCLMHFIWGSSAKSTLPSPRSLAQMQHALETGFVPITRAELLSSIASAREAAKPAPVPAPATDMPTAVVERPVTPVEAATEVIMEMDPAKLKAALKMARVA